MTTTNELIDRLEIISRVETDLFWLTAQRLRELDRKSSVADALNDSAYISGAQAGFNCALSADAEALNKLIASRNGYLKPLKNSVVQAST